MNTVSDLFLSTVEKHPGRMAVVEGDRRVTYETLDLMVRGLSSFLISRGIGYGDRVAILIPNSIEFAASFFSISRLGAISVPINVGCKEDEIRFYVSHSHAKILITEDWLRSAAEKATVETGVSIVIIKGEKTDWSFSGGIAENHVNISIKPSDEAIYLYSTGSTGRPKRVSRTHFNLVALADNHTQTIGWTETDRILLTIPLSHTYGFGNFISAVKVGASMYVLGEFNRNKIIDIIESESITVFPAVPFMLNVIAETFLPKPRDFSSLRLVISAGAPLSKETFYKFYEKFGIYPRQFYGSTETGVISINLGDEKRFDSVGIPVKNVEVRIFRDDGTEADINEVGEIAVKSPSMTTGYYGLQEETERAFRGGYYFTGDLGRIDEEGYIYIVGRKKLIINVAGNKVDPTEVENILLNHPKIKDAVVIGVKDKYGNESVKAVIVAKEDIDIKEVHNYCKGHISDFKIPRIVEFRDEIPRSPTGKVLREHLK
ncbi:MAG: acyl-CoA synthetase [Candidatus Dadabacteria bacterium]